MIKTRIENTMNKATTFIVTMLLSLSMTQNIQAQNISWSTSDGFTNIIITIQTTSNQQTRYNNALNYFSSTHATTKQLQDVCFYLTNDQEKYNLCVAAYPNIIDKEHFINIYNSFSSFSNAIRLYRETQGKDELLSVQYNYQLNLEQDRNAKFDLFIHQGDVLLSVNKFDEAISAYLQAQKLKPEDPAPSLRIEEVRRWQQELDNINHQQNHINVQFESLVQQGDHLLAYSLFDEAISSYEQAMTLKPGDQTAYNRIKEANRRKQEYTYVETAEAPCTTGTSEFSHILTTVKSQSFADERKEMAKRQISKNCLSMEQMRELVPLFNMDDDKLEMIKFMYDYAEYPAKMYLFRDLLSFSSSKKEFDNFLILKE